MVSLFSEKTFSASTLGARRDADDLDVTAGRQRVRRRHVLGEVVDGVALGGDRARRRRTPLRRPSERSLASPEKSYCFTTGWPGVP